MPPNTEGTLHVYGEIEAAKVKYRLRAAHPQGINPKILLLEITPELEEGDQKQGLKYVEELESPTQYSQVQIQSIGLTIDIGIVSLNTLAGGHSLRAWTYPMDFNPHLTIAGTISTNGEKPVVELEEQIPPPTKPEPGVKFLKFGIDVYDPQGPGTLLIATYNDPLNYEPCTKVKIYAKNGLIELDVEQRSRGRGAKR